MKNYRHTVPAQGRYDKIELEERKKGRWNGPVHVLPQSLGWWGALHPRAPSSPHSLVMSPSSLPQMQWGGVGFMTSKADLGNTDSGKVFLGQALVGQLV